MKTKINDILKNAYVETIPGSEFSATTVFLGNESQMESIDLVSFILLVEDKINSEFNSSISLMDEKAFSSKNSPFKNAESLMNYIQERLA